MISVGFQTLIVCILMNCFSCHMGESFDLSFEYGDLVSVQMHVLVNFRSLIYRVHNTIHPICTQERKSLQFTIAEPRASCYRKIFLLVFFRPGCGIAPFFWAIVEQNE